MTTAYSKDTSLQLSASDGKVVADGNKIEVSVGSDVTALDLTAKLASEYGYIRVNGTVARTETPYTVDLSRNNFVTLTYTVYAEDHETTEVYTVNIKKALDLSSRTDVNKTLTYFVNCGDYDVTTLSEGDLFGTNNGVTDQAYGMDPVTGYSWGIVDTLSNPLKNGTVTSNAAMTNAVFTDNTWPFETDTSLSDESAKNLTNRYTKNQFENGIARNLNYDFELENGVYDVTLYFADPWGCSKNPIVSAEGNVVLENVAVGQEVTAKVEVKDEKLSLNITSPDATLCLNLAYIMISQPEGKVIEDDTTTGADEDAVNKVMEAIDDVTAESTAVLAGYATAGKVYFALAELEGLEKATAVRVFMTLDDGSVVEIKDAKIVDGKVEFTTEYSGTVVIVDASEAEDTKEEDTNGTDGKVDGSVQTGDNARAGLYVVMLMAGLVAMVYAGFTSLRRQKSRK